MELRRWRRLWTFSEKESSNCLKLKRKGDVSWCGVNGVIAGVQEMERVREEVSVLLKYVWHSALLNFGCVSSRILWNSSFQGLKFVWWYDMAPMKEMVKKEIA